MAKRLSKKAKTRGLSKKAKIRAEIQKAISQIDAQIQKVMSRAQPLPARAGEVLTGGATGNLKATPDDLKALRSEVDDLLGQEMADKYGMATDPPQRPMDPEASYRDWDDPFGGSPESGYEKGPIPNKPFEPSADDVYGPSRPNREQRKAQREAEAARKAASEARAKVVDEKMGAWGKKKGFATNLRVKARKAMGAGGRAAWKSGSWLNPASIKGGLLIGALPFAADFVKNSVAGTKEMFGVGSQMFDGVSAVDEMLGQQNAAMTVSRIQEKRRQRLEALRAQNRMRLMQTSPHLAQSLLAGMELPTDGVVIGGRPRIDLLDQVADQMGAGVFSAPDEME